MKVTIVLALTIFMFNGCSCEPKVIDKIVYIKSDCPKIVIPEILSHTDYSDLNISYNVEEVENEKN